MKEQYIQMFKTTNNFGIWQVPAAILLLLVSIAIPAAMVTSYIIHNNRQYLSMIILIFGSFVVLHMTIVVTISWFRDFYSIELYEDYLVGYTLFGTKKKSKLYFSDINEIGKHINIYNIVLNSVEFYDINGKRYDITADIDFYGYICDYIIKKSLNCVIVDEKLLINKRKNYKVWKYTRSNPYNTIYEDGYLDWLSPIVEKQKEEMIAKGILKKGVFYGDNEEDGPVSPSLYGG